MKAAKLLCIFSSHVNFLRPHHHLKASAEEAQQLISGISGRVSSINNHPPTSPNARVGCYPPNGMNENTERLKIFGRQHTPNAKGYSHTHKIPSKVSPWNHKLTLNREPLQSRYSRGTPSYPVSTVKNQPRGPNVLVGRHEVFGKPRVQQQAKGNCCRSNKRSERDIQLVQQQFQQVA